MSAASFYAPVPETPREDLLRAYQGFLEERNGAWQADGTAARREAWLTAEAADPARHAAALDAELFERLYVRFEGANHPPALLALLAFVKMNAGEAYGVEVISRIRHGRPETGELFDTVERTLGREERYHTRILLGATGAFGLAPPRGAWRPPLPLKLLIATLAYTPRRFFHPVLLGAEIGGVFILNWLICRVGEIFRHEPALRDALERRLSEVLVDELGHIAFNRLAVGPTGVKVARRFARLAAMGTIAATPEFRALGWGPGEGPALERFDVTQVPQEVRRRAFFA